MENLKAHSLLTPGTTYIIVPEDEAPVPEVDPPQSFGVLNESIVGTPTIIFHSTST